MDTTEIHTSLGEVILPPQGEGVPMIVGRRDSIVTCPSCESSKDQIYMRSVRPSEVVVAWCPCGTIYMASPKSAATSRGKALYDLLKDPDGFQS